MTGVVLCGGTSSRMGTDKGLVNQNNVTWVQSAYNKLASLGIKVVVSVNDQQSEKYQGLFHSSELIIDSDKISIHGPLRGLMSAHLNYPSEDLVVLACDMPLMETHILKRLIDSQNLDSSFETYLFSNEGEPEPLCGIYTSTGLEKVLNLYHEEKLIRHSMKFMIEQLRSFQIPLETTEQRFFVNINTRSGLDSL